MNVSGQYELEEMSRRIRRLNGAAATQVLFSNPTLRLRTRFVVGLSCSWHDHDSKWLHRISRIWFYEL
ncbi:hypothetical protein L6164_021778 [Bauhinia variegata]|uniref:Uncharacterized protein n=1 Tax=Bauhinia variegata TaxID=167791 RepID=A0ACB9MGE6_BAUVA|nr:hypothetical protein L6164_021778 [Bauhinia variegata]